MDAIILFFMTPMGTVLLLIAAIGTFIYSGTYTAPIRKKIRYIAAIVALVVYAVSGRFIPSPQNAPGYGQGFGQTGFFQLIIGINVALFTYLATLLIGMKVSKRTDCP
jgi:hypothetical protein